jgi:hypothetical protein
MKNNTRSPGRSTVRTLRTSERIVDDFRATYIRCALGGDSDNVSNRSRTADALELEYLTTSFGF